MNEQIRTLGQVIDNRRTEQGQRQGFDTDMSFNTFLTIYSINLVHRFPDVSDVHNIDFNTVDSIARLSYACARVALTTWNELVAAPETDERVREERRTRLQRSA